MRGFFALVAREVSERRAMLIAAVVASLIPLVSPLFPATGSNPPADIREAVLWFIVVTLIPIFAVLLGATFIGRDLSEGRLGFYLSQPMSAPVIWFAKFGAVVMLIWAVQLILMLPTALMSEDASRVFLKTIGVPPYSGIPLSLLILWVGPVALILIAHSVGVAWRARSAWIVLDLVALGVIAVATRLVLGPFLRVFAVDAVMTVVGWMLACAFVAMMVAGAVQLSAGRVDPKRGHRALSGTVWVGMVIAVILAAGWGWWVRSAAPEDLFRVHEISLGAGSWIAVTGASAGRMDYYPGFLINVEDGEWMAAHFGSDIHERGVTFSADMSRAVWTVPAGFEESNVMVADLNGESLRPRWIGVAVDRQWRGIVLSDDGSRLAVIEGDNVVAYEVDSGDLLAAARLDDGFVPVMIRFEGDAAVAVLALKNEKVSDDSSASRSRWKEHRFNIETRDLDEGRAIGSPWRWVVPGWSNRFGYALERFETEGENRLQVVDPAIGAVVADLGEMPARWTDIEVVENGRIAVLRDHDERYSIEVFNPDGEHLLSIDLPAGGWMRLGGEVSAGVLAVDRTVWTRDGDIPAHRKTYLVDLETGSLGLVLDGVSPVLGGWRSDVSSGAWQVGSVATRLMIGEGFTLRLLDTETGDLRQLVPFPD